MSFMQNTIAVIFIILLFSLDAFSQRNMRKAEAAMELNHYSEAIDYYKSQLNRRRNKQEVISKANYKIGYCYLRLSLPEKAESYFKLAIESGFSKPEIYFYYGQTLQMQQQYFEALQQYEILEEKYPGNKLAKRGIASVNYSFEMLREPTRYEVNIVAKLSSGESDYSPFFEQRNYRTVYFTSTRFSNMHDIDNPESGDFNSNIYYAEKNRQGGWENPKILPGFVNTENEEGAACLNLRSSNLYFTRCKYDKKNDTGCRIYMAKKSGRFWGRVEKVEIPGIPKNVSIGHPAISNDELALYFSADKLPVNYGGKDIYKVKRERRNHNFGNPINLGPEINTEGDEMYPHIRRNGVLYFSSNGHPGMGGLDIFKAIKSNGSYKVENMGSPINSSHDDFGIVFMGYKEEGFLSSRRHRGMGKTDIFHFILPEKVFSISGTVYDNMTMEKINNVEIQIMDEEFKLVELIYSDKHGNYYTEIEPQTEYTIRFNAEGYKKETVNIDTRNITDSKDFKRDIFLNK